MDAEANPFTVDVRRVDGAWVVAIVDGSGRVAASRTCRDEADAMTYASTVRQHAYWLSEAKFREYYRLEEG